MTAAPCTAARSSRSVVAHFGDQVLHTVIARTVKFPDATLAAEPIDVHAATHPVPRPTGSSRAEDRPRQRP